MNITNSTQIVYLAPSVKNRSLWEFGRRLWHSLHGPDSIFQIAYIRKAICYYLFCGDKEYEIPSHADDRESLTQKLISALTRNKQIYFKDTAKFVAECRAQAFAGYEKWKKSKERYKSERKHRESESAGEQSRQYEEANDRRAEEARGRIIRAYNHLMKLKGCVSIREVMRYAKAAYSTIVKVLKAYRLANGLGVPGGYVDRSNSSQYLELATRSKKQPETHETQVKTKQEANEGVINGQTGNVDRQSSSHACQEQTESRYPECAEKREMGEDSELFLSREGSGSLDGASEDSRILQHRPEDSEESIRNSVQLSASPETYSRALVDAKSAQHYDDSDDLRAKIQASKEAYKTKLADAIRERVSSTSDPITSATGLSRLGGMVNKFMARIQSDNQKKTPPPIPDTTSSTADGVKKFLDKIMAPPLIPNKEDKYYIEGWD
jgi:hypothetical protein